MLSSVSEFDTDPAVALVRSFIVDGSYAPGDRLPPERQLTEALGIGRSVLRRALDALERDGVLWRHVGKGTFIAHEPARDAGQALPRIARSTTPFQMMRARLCVEPAIAREAAMHASAEALNRMALAGDRARAAACWRDYEAEDDRFHRSIAEATDNLPLLAIFDQLNVVRRAVAWTNVERANLEPPRDHPSFAEHAEIAEAIVARRPDAAQAAMRRHLKSVETRLFGE